MAFTISEPLRRTLVGIFSGILSILIVLYSILWIYINCKTDNNAIKNYRQKINVTLTDEQARIIWFFHTNNKKYKYTWYPPFFEMFLADPNDNIDLIVGQMLVGDFSKYTSIEAHFVSYAMKRFVNRKMNWRESIEIFVSNMYFENEVYGIKNASEKYYNKAFEKLTENEIIGLLAIERKPNSAKSTDLGTF
jgi:membrane carboxypeptidase/penicillin-binding protein PbpC